MLARAALGDRLAFADLYRATSAKLFAVLLRMLKNEEMAEDALQDVFIKVWHRAGEYHAGKGTVMTWLISIARYRAIDMLRRARAGVQTVSEEQRPLDSHPARDGDPVERTCRVSDDARLAACLDELDAQRRACLVLAYCEGYTHDELSQRVGSPLGTIKSWIRRGLLALKSCLERADG
ncbi:MAG: sigma-70 family RNA polymerase sigma factor [Gammaproteobacteria bacterium]|nr:sigma-70 family RNA polymerase sigma factor [Gammaproteobacteria bacterium]